MSFLFNPLRYLLLIVALFTLTACSDDDDDDHNPPAETSGSIVDVAVADGNFTTLVAALQATGLDQTLADPDATFTVFAPTDAAFALLGEDRINALLADTDTLSDILTYHVISGSVDSSAAIASAGQTVAMVNGDSVGLSLDGADLLVNTSTVTAVDIMAGNGIIHVIDAVLMPPADIDSPTEDIVGTAIAAGDFGTLVTALQATGLDGTLSNPDETFTVFAPTDAAFAVLGDETINTLLGDTTALSAILLQHVVQGSAVDSVTAYTLNGGQATTAGGTLVDIAINSTADSLTFGGANVVIKDIYTTNGIIHVIDAVVVGDVEVPEPLGTIVDVAVANGGFTTLVTALQATGLDQTLADTSATYTVFAPTDDAFALLGDEAINDLLADTATLSDILTYHVISGSVDSTAAMASAGQTVTMVNGDAVGLSLDGADLLVNSATVTMIDIPASNGIIHVIDAVLTPLADMGSPTQDIVQTAVAAGTFSTLVSALQATGLDATLSNPDETFTVFAPTDAAFAVLGQSTIDLLLADTATLSSILLQHVVQGAAVNSVTAFTLNGGQATTAGGTMIDIAIDSGSDTLSFGGATVSTTDIYTTNGVIHVLDAVVVGDVEVPQPLGSLVDVAVADGRFTTLVTALQATGLDAVLADTGTDYTVFAPTDEAFALLGTDTINALLADTDTLSDILLYHVISEAKIDSTGAISVASGDSSQVTMANGDNTALSLAGETLFVNASKVSATDVMAENGIIHVVDQVILPPADKGTPTDDIVATAIATPEFSTLVTALTAANLVETLQGDGPFTVFAPTDAAFDKIEDSTLEALLADTDALTQVLLQHVVSGEVNSIAAYEANGTSVNTVAEDDVTIALVDLTAGSNTADDEVAYDATNQLLVGGTGSTQPGFTLYVFDSDLGTAGSACNDGCATSWPPVLVTDGTVSSIPGLGTITRDDSSIQATYNGRPLYFFAGDTAAGDTNGQGVNDVWWQVNLNQILLQVQGSNVTTTDIYTTNGVIHVIDTVITETLQ